MTSFFVSNSLKCQRTHKTKWSYEWPLPESLFTGNYLHHWKMHYSKKYVWNYTNVWPYFYVGKNIISCTHTISTISQIFRLRITSYSIQNSSLDICPSKVTSCSHSLSKSSDIIWDIGLLNLLSLQNIINTFTKGDW